MSSLFGNRVFEKKQKTLAFVSVKRQLVATNPSGGAAATLFFRHSELPPNDTHMGLGPMPSVCAFFVFLFACVWIQCL